GSLLPRELEPPQSVDKLVEDALDHPIDADPLEKSLTASAKVLLLVDDITRQTPAAALLPGIFRRLKSAGVARSNVTILIAAGTHSHMTQQELGRKLGPETLQTYQVVLHHWREENHLRRIGETTDGTPIRVNRMLAEADLVVGVGQIVPHRVMGFTGGSSIVQPGVSGPEITGRTHWLSALYPGAEIMGFADNPVRREVEQIAKQAGLRFIVNVVMDGRERVIHVVAGDPIAAHHKGAAYSRSIYGAAQSGPADVVVAESYPADYDLWQAAKGIYSSELAVKQGGVVVLVTKCSHGVSSEHPEVERLGYRPVEDIRAMVAAKEITDLVAAAHLAHVGRVIRDRARGIMVSEGIPIDVQRRIGFEPARSPQQALQMALELAGGAAKVVVLQQGGHVLPLHAEIQSPKSKIQNQAT
ncbi:MAG TPA: nickel-dependent lactate racemase, partial [Terriglobia bacterium]|nr:nickel-dependent lactate racemase [Terriglobia bacterium]